MNTNGTNRKDVLRRNDLVYPELSYSVIGVLFDVFNELGYGYREKYYQRAIAEEFKSLGMPFREELRFPVLFKGKQVGWHVFDFFIDNKIVLEIGYSSPIHKKRPEV